MRFLLVNIIVELLLLSVITATLWFCGVSTNGVNRVAITLKGVVGIRLFSYILILKLFSLTINCPRGIG